MKDINYYLSLPYKLEIIPDQEEGGYLVSYPDLKGCLSYGDTIDEAYTNALDAKAAWLDAALEEGIEIPEPRSEGDYSGQFRLRMPRTLHKTLAENAQAEGISMNQYCIYILSKYA